MMCIFRNLQTSMVLIRCSVGGKGDKGFAERGPIDRFSQWDGI